jgi:hypothetical protein
VPHYLSRKKSSASLFLQETNQHFFSRYEEVIDFFLKKRSTFFKSSIIEVLLVAPTKKINNDTRDTARSLRAQFLQ